MYQKKHKTEEAHSSQEEPKLPSKDNQYIWQKGYEICFKIQQWNVKTGFSIQAFLDYMGSCNIYGSELWVCTEFNVQGLLHLV